MEIEMDTTQLSVAVVIPAYNEAETILKLINTLLSYSFIHHVVVVDDTPNDSTVAQLDSLKNNKRVMVIHRKKKGGRGSAVMDGMRALLSNYTPDYIIEMDADFSHQPQEIPHLIEMLRKKNAGLVLGSRYLPESTISNWPLKRKIFSRYANKFAKSLLRIPVSDYTNGFRAYSYSAAKLVSDNPLLGTGFIALSDVLVRVFYNGFTIAEIPTQFHNRTRGESSLGMREIANAFFGIFKIYFFSKKLKKRES